MITQTRTTKEWIEYILNKIFGYLPKTGGTVTGDINMSGNKITGLPEPTEDTDAINKQYFDESLSSQMLVVKSQITDLSDTVTSGVLDVPTPSGYYYTGICSYDLVYPESVPNGDERPIRITMFFTRSSGSASRVNWRVDLNGGTTDGVIFTAYVLFRKL